MAKEGKPLMEQVLIDYLKEKGLKLTPARLGVLKAISRFQGHFDADEVVDLLRRESSRISRATVYRTLPLFTQCGLIRETVRSSGKTNYEKCFGSEHHDHMLCLGCGRVIEFKVDEIERLQDELCRKYGFKPVDHKLSIQGYCRKCRAH